MRIANARWLEPEGRWNAGAIEIVEGRLHLCPGDDGPGDLDAGPCMVLPGLIDGHTHLREPGQEHKEGIDSGTRAALAGGVTTVLDMPNDKPPTCTAEALAAKKALYRQKSRVNWGLHLMAVPGGAEVDPTTIPAAKLYMARSSSVAGLTAREQVEEVLSTWPAVIVHAEDERCFCADERHHRARPRESVVSALATLTEVIQGLERRPRVILAHAATAEEVDWLRSMKANGYDVWGETCPHYAFLTEADYEREPPLYQVNPPIRALSDLLAVRQGLADGAIDFLHTDHAPHTQAEKGSEHPPSGIAGIEWLAPLAMRLVHEGVLTWERYAQVTAARAAACYRMTDRGGIREGAWADLALVRVGTDQGRVVTRAGTRPYAHVQMEHTVAATLVNGHVAYREGSWSNELHAQEIYP